MILKDHNHSLGCYLVIRSHQIDYFWEKSRSRLIRWKILTVAQVRDEDGLGSGSINNRRERVNGSKNKNRKHFTDKQFRGYKQPSPTEAFVMFLMRRGRGAGGREGVVYLGAHKERGIHSSAFSLISSESTYPPEMAQMSSLPHALSSLALTTSSDSTALCAWAKKKKTTVLPLPLVVRDACFHFQIWNSCGVDSYLGHHRASVLAESESSSVLPKVCAKYLNKTTV